MASKTKGLTHKEMREIQDAGRGRALEEMRRQRAQESGPCCWICAAPLEVSPRICTACGSLQDAERQQTGGGA